jgi:flagellar biosynthetic protein FliR
MSVAWAAYAGLLLARIAAWAAVLPVIAGRTSPLVRVGMVVVIAGFYLAGQPPPWDARWAALADRLHAVVYLLGVLREVLIGAAMGVLFGLWLMPARVAGEFLSFQIGLNVAPLPGPTGEEGAGTLTALMEVLAALVFLSMDGHHILLAVLHASWSALPLGGTALPQVAPMVQGLKTSYELGLLLAGPVAACLVLLAVTLALLARTAPQLNIYSVGFTLQVTVVLLASAVLLPEMVQALQVLVQGYGGQLPQMLRGD